MPGNFEMNSVRLEEVPRTVDGEVPPEAVGEVPLEAGGEVSLQSFEQCFEGTETETETETVGEVPL